MHVRRVVLLIVLPLTILCITTFRVHLHEVSSSSQRLLQSTSSNVVLDSSNQRSVTTILRNISSLSNAVTVMCIILTTPDNWDTKAKAVLNTWAKRCHIPLFFYSRSSVTPRHPILNSTLTVALDVPDGRKHLTGKTMSALKYSLKAYGHKADWFLKCDDDTYIIWENLMYLLREYRPESEIYLGYIYRSSVPRGFTAGGAGYLLSKPAVQKLVHESHRFPKACRQGGGWEDHDVGKCLSMFRIFPKRTHGTDGKLRFHAHNPLQLLEGDPDHNERFYFSTEDVAIGNPAAKKNFHIMSEDAVSFHRLSPGQMYIYDYLLYRLKRH